VSEWRSSAGTVGEDPPFPDDDRQGGALPQDREASSS
jgi:hypothetical protein